MQSVLSPHIVLPLRTPLIEWLSDHILEEFAGGADPGEAGAASPTDLSSVAVVFPGKRPALYLRRALGGRLGRPYLPPSVYDIDELMADVAARAENERGLVRRETGEVEVLQLLYRLAKRTLTEGQRSGASEAACSRLPVATFERFFFWGLRLLEVFDELATELVTPASLRKASTLALSEAGLSAEALGLWPVLPDLYESWQDALDAHGFWTRGERYRVAAAAADRMAWPYGRMYLAGFAALSKAEERLFSVLTRRGLATVVIQEGGEALTGRDETWGPLERLRAACHGPWQRAEDAGDLPRPRISLYQGFDTHSQLHLARGIVRNWPEPTGELAPGEEAIILPRPEPLLPVLSWVVAEAGRHYNISMGYPLQRTPASQLLDSLFDAQEGRLGGRYYVPHYLAVLRHPYVRGYAARLADGMAHLVQCLEDSLREEGRAFAGLDDIEAIAGRGGDAAGERLGRIHDLCFRALEKASSLASVASALRALLGILIEEGSVSGYPLAGDFLGALLKLLDGLCTPAPDGAWPGEAQSTTREGDQADSPFTIIRYLVHQRRIPFLGTPLSGLQVLGLLETRCLHFDRIVILDVNEGVLPPEPGPDVILPPGLRRHLSLPDHRAGTLLARYHLHRLLAGCKEAHLVYSEGHGAVRSRFVEEFLWAAEKKEGRLGALPVVRRSYSSVAPRPSPMAVRKRPEVVQYLADFTYSASALDTYVACPLRFYGRHVLGFDEEAPLGGDEIDPARVGGLVHRALQSYYRGWLGGEIRFGPEDGEGGRLAETVDAVLVEDFGPSGHWSGAVDLFREVLMCRLANFLRLEREASAGHRLLGIELVCRATFVVDGRPARLKGVIDRVEGGPGETVLVIDYKTGSRLPLPGTDLKDHFGDNVLSYRDVGPFQLPLYLYLYREAWQPGLDWSKMDAIVCHLRGLNETSAAKDCYHSLASRCVPEASSLATVFDRCFLPSLTALIRDIRDPDRPFCADPADPRNCEHCPFRAGLCPRG